VSIDKGQFSIETVSCLFFFSFPLRAFLYILVRLKKLYNIWYRLFVQFYWRIGWNEIGEEQQCEDISIVNPTRCTNVSNLF